MPTQFEQIADMFCAIARNRPHDVAVVAPCGTDSVERRAYVHQTYRQMDEDSSRLAHGLAKLNTVHLRISKTVEISSMGR
jgi:acyl-CoA synthetase (AMP-forming)/AMP-acid ligase II